MIHIFIDTNIWVRVLSQGRPGCEPAHLAELRSLLDSSQVILVLPEIVILELEKAWRTFMDEVATQMVQLERRIEDLIKQKVWTEVEDIPKALKPFLAERKEQKIRTAEANYKQIQDLLKHPKIVHLPLTPDLLFLGRKRIIAGRMPEAENKAHLDACIIEALLGYFKDKNTANPQLYFCSENVSDFALPMETKHTLHPLVKDGLPPCEYFITLGDMMEFYKSNAKVVEPSKEEIDDALKRDREESAKQQSSSKCAAKGCRMPHWVFAPYCRVHFWQLLDPMSPEERQVIFSAIDAVLNTLSYREREILKLRYGLGDGYIYTKEECGRIFKRSVSTIRRLESVAIRKLRHPIRIRGLREKWKQVGFPYADER